MGAGQVEEREWDSCFFFVHRPQPTSPNPPSESTVPNKTKRRRLPRAPCLDCCSTAPSTSPTRRWSRTGTCGRSRASTCAGGRWRRRCWRSRRGRWRRRSHRPASLESRAADRERERECVRVSLRVLNRRDTDTDTSGGTNVVEENGSREGSSRRRCAPLASELLRSRPPPLAPRPSFVHIITTRSGSK